MSRAGFAFHCHHDKLYEYVFDFDFDERVESIKKYKPLKEQPLRLRLFQLIPDDKIPAKDSVEWTTYIKAREACSKEWEAHNKAREAYLLKYSQELEELHTELCPNCPWNGKTIFTRRNAKGEWY